MKKGKIIQKFKDKCLNCKKPMTIIARKSSLKGCRKHDILVANVYCSKKCEKEFKKKLDKIIAFSEGYEKAEKDIMKKLKWEIKWIKNHVSEIKHFNKSYHQGSIDILEIIIGSIKKNGLIIKTTKKGSDTKVIKKDKKLIRQFKKSLADVKAGRIKRVA